MAMVVAGICTFIVFCAVVLLIAWCMMVVAGDADERAERIYRDLARHAQEQEEQQAAQGVRKKEAAGAQ